MSAPTSRPVHPCVTSVFDGGRGAEYSTWAYLTTRSPQIPNLVTAQASTVRVYTLDEESGKLFETYVFSNLAGNICYLETLRAAEHGRGDDDNSHAKKQPDSLLLGFCGHPRLTVVTLTPQMAAAPSPALLSATSLIDLTQPLMDASFGSVTPLEHDLVAATVAWKNEDGVTIAVILGAGVAVALIDLQRCQAGWIANEPYLLPLPTLSASIRRSHSAKSQSAISTAPSGGTAAAANANTSSIATGFGDIVSSTFLSGYIEPTLVLLHSNPNQHGRTWSGRLGRPHGQSGTQHGLLVTAISVTVAHKRSAILWSVEVPADARSLHPIGKNGCLVLCTNSLLSISNTGRIEDFLAVNGFVKSTCPARLLEILQPNPKPFPKLAIQLDGAMAAFCSDNAVFLSLRGGRLYLLQLPSPGDEKTSRMSLLPLGRTLGALGHIASLIVWPITSAAPGLYDKFAAGTKAEENTHKTAGKLHMGLVFAGSRLGDSSLLGYALEDIAVPWTDDEADAKRIKQDDSSDADPETPQSVTPKVEEGYFAALDAIPSRVSPELDEILRLEEEALYAPTTSKAEEANKIEPNVVPPSDEEDSDELLPVHQRSRHGSLSQTTSTKRKLSRVSTIVVLRAFTALDSLTGLGPLGPSCEGPIAPPNLQEELNSIVKPNAASVPGATALIVPCGFGSSGGLGIITAPGRDERSILVEEDCLDIYCIFSLRSHNLVFLGMKAGTGVRILRLNSGSSSIKSEDASSSKVDLSEVSLEEWCKTSADGDGDANSPLELFTNATLLACADFVDGSFTVALAYPRDPQNPGACFYGGAILKEGVSGQLQTVTSFAIPSQEDSGNLLSMTPLTVFESDKNKVLTVFACTWSSGVANLVAVDDSGVCNNYQVPGADTAAEPMEDDDSDQAINTYYSSKKVVALDLFRAPENFFEAPSNLSSQSGKSVAEVPSMEPSGSEMEALLAGDRDLYYISDQSGNGVEGRGEDTKRQLNDEAGWKAEALFLGVCRQNGALEVFLVSDCLSSEEPIPIWSCTGCGHGVTTLSTTNTRHRPPRSWVCVREMRFFFCGPSEKSRNQNAPSPSRPLCVSIETSDGDLMVYAADARTRPSANLRFSRVPLKVIARESQEQTKFHSKLVRKGIVGKSTVNVFRHNRLHRFQSISGQDGLFAATCRPVWLVAERGKPEAIAHRTRHAAPAGGKPLPVTGFCAGLDGEGSFLTLHERVGRVGSQRLTVHAGISSMFQSEGLLPGGGLCLQKKLLGVTVRRIQFIDDVSVSSGGHCLYAVLVSRELEADMSKLNDDGMTQEERERIEQEKEAAKIKRQVEADLGGFDVEQEWVEEIEREDCFQIDKDLGGAPPVPQSSYALWIVDAAANWVVVDSYELGEYEHGMTMGVMSLTDFPEEPGSATVEEIPSEDLETKLFVTVGVGIVDKNGEDVSSKGKVLLFEVKAPEDSSRITSSQTAELALVCEKDIFHGPVTSLSCLTSEGKHRLIIGAGADVNVEQWGNGKLTQVGFFRATMQVLDIFMFKNFLLLSDAYDSLYFLVWRESDKSLTLLSKEYDPLAVYAAGTMSRGGSLSFICQDDRQNLQFFQYAPGEAAARGGNKLVCRADYHLGAQTSAFHNHICRSSLWINSATPSSTLAALKQQDTFFGRADDDQRLGTHFGTSDGGFGAIVPLSEPVYWRLTALQSVMANALESDCALSQRAWRLYRRSYRRGGCRSNDRKKGVIDGDLVLKYSDLPRSDQEDLASAIGSTVELILDNLLEIKCANMVI